MIAPVAPFTFIDLFAGIGGFHQALDAPPEFNGRCVLAVEIDSDCERVYRANWPAVPFVSDIRTLTRDADGDDRLLDDIADDIPDHDVLCAGFPCQPFSKSGAQQGVNDRTRGTLFHDIMLVVRAKRPRFVILENVRNLAGPKHRDTFATIIESLRDARYRVADEPTVFSPHLLPAELHGAPQVRERVFVLAERADRWLRPSGLVGPDLVENKPFDGWSPDDWRIDSILQDDSEIRDIYRYRLRPEEIGWINAWQVFVQGIEDDALPGFPIWADAFNFVPQIEDGCPEWKRDFLQKNAAFYARHQQFIDEWRELRWGQLEQRLDEFPASRRKFEWQARKWQPTRASRDLWELVMHFRPSGIRVKPPTYLPALVAITQTSIIGPRGRRITPIEAARLQGMGDSVILRGEVDDAVAYRQLGNAVNVGAVQHVARALMASANGKDSR